MSKLGRWWRKHQHVEPAIQPAPPLSPKEAAEKSHRELLERYGAKNTDELWETICSQTISSHGEVPAYDLRAIVEIPKFETPMRDGKPATIYVYVDPTDTHNPPASYEFESIEQIDTLIETIRWRYHQRIKRETASLKKVREKLS
jgi:hypothetical protein